ncbi:helix-turn-helix transcriptional regulator [Rhizobiales bacterium]|uniref:helix-turn-helix transcriptional regulator n=1 Tax=Hongsoonwoonella zoysiae TaxID=2821844 RepID=UPI001560D67E|nr:helix-turn-helix transcriptional regulator [Hongsoonwoonella zoysiae]NRG17787.1 helix-turn-helix transcriptional regulator [Hongsoonwoonella zoysiae]
MTGTKEAPFAEKRRESVKTTDTGFDGQLGETNDHAPLLELNDRYERAAFVVDSEARLIEANEHAGRLLECGADVRLRGSFIEFAEKNRQHSFSDTLTELHDRSTGSRREFIIERPSTGRRPIHVEIQKISGVDHFLIIAVDLNDTSIGPMARLRQVFDLTSREADIARLMATPLTEAEIALSLGISTNTLRSHRKTIYAKLNVANRVDLTLLLHRLA